MSAKQRAFEKWANRSTSQFILRLEARDTMSELIFKAGYSAAMRARNPKRGLVAKLVAALKVAEYFTAWDSAAQADYPFRHSLAYQEAMEAVNGATRKKGKR